MVEVEDAAFVLCMRLRLMYESHLRTPTTHKCLPLLVELQPQAKAKPSISTIRTRPPCRSILRIPATPRHHTMTTPSGTPPLSLSLPSVPSTVTATTPTPTTNTSTALIPSTSRPPTPAKRQVKVRLDARLHSHDFPFHLWQKSLQ